VVQSNRLTLRFNLAEEIEIEQQEQERKKITKKKENM
jgi:hypothetical protein